MNTVDKPSLPAFNATQSAYDYIAHQIEALILSFGLQRSQPQIMQIYETICKDSLAFPFGLRPPAYSRINHDGTPFQFAVNLGTPSCGLQFLSEAGHRGLTADQRLQANLNCITTLVNDLHVNTDSLSVVHLLQKLAPTTNPALLSDPAGAFWIGVAFAPERQPQLRIYVNANWGNNRDRWDRLELFASYFGARDAWHTLQTMLASDMQPLGMAITLSQGKPLTGRIYLSAYGKRMSYYEHLAEVLSRPTFSDFLQQYAKCILGNDYPYPTQTAVCSFGLSMSQAFDFKFELCGHCLFSSDLEAVNRLQTWFTATNLDATAYFKVLNVLSDAYLSDTSPELHCYLGVGASQDSPYFTVYLKPRLKTAHGH